MAVAQWRLAVLRGNAVATPAALLATWTALVKLTSVYTAPGIPRHMGRRPLKSWNATVQHHIDVVTRVQQIVEQFREWQDVARYPIGSFTAVDYERVHTGLALLQQGEGVTQAEAVNVSLDMVERLVQEVATPGRQSIAHHSTLQLWQGIVAQLESGRAAFRWTPRECHVIRSGTGETAKNG